MQQLKIENIEIEFYTSFDEWDQDVASKSYNRAIKCPKRTLKAEAYYDLNQDKLLVYRGERAEFNDLFSITAKALGSVYPLDHRFISPATKGKHYQEFALQSFSVTNYLLSLIPDWEPIGYNMFVKKKMALSQDLFPLSSYYCGNDIFIFQNYNRTWNLIKLYKQKDKKTIQSFEFQLTTHKQFLTALEQIKNTSTNENI